MAACELCGGKGERTVISTCHICKGTGEIIAYEEDGTEYLATCTLCEFGLIYTEVKCDACHGIQESNKQEI